MSVTRGKVLMAMSGGVDSSVGAALLQRAGYEVVGVFMRLGSPGEALDEMVCETKSRAPSASPSLGTFPSGEGQKVKLGHQGCCSVSDAADARLVAARLGIPFYVVNFKKDFGRIMDYFADEYGAGRTPNPCVRCNDWLKFGKLHEYAVQIGAEFVASGHYARVEDGRLLRGLDHDKDQSYVLFGMPRERLGRMLLPIGGMRKGAVRALAEEMGLPVFNKPDSQEICFVPDNDYGSFVERRRPGLVGEGAIVDVAGKRVGSHGGQHRFTIGQRRGVGVALGYPIFVVDKDPGGNTVTVGPREMLLSGGCTVGEANWLVDDGVMEGWTPGWIKYRYNTEAVRGEYKALGRAMGDCESPTPSGRTGRFEVRFEEPQEAVTAGQALVVYGMDDPAVVLGGGWIERVQRSSKGA